MEYQIFGKLYNVFTKGLNKNGFDRIEGHRIITFRTITVYENGLVYFKNEWDGPHLFLNVDHYIAREPQFVGFQYHAETTTDYGLIASLLMKDAKFQDVEILKQIMIKISDLFQIE